MDKPVDLAGLTFTVDPAVLGNPVKLRGCYHPVPDAARATPYGGWMDLSLERGRLLCTPRRRRRRHETDCYLGDLRAHHWDGWRLHHARAESSAARVRQGELAQ